uniref:hypothetical protein n=1 Tax=Altererythrobacter segetis TaxID=1104773 RepID=UPI00140A6BEF|nr:hypothetical protein [Altererythrobacter segetis]
MNRRHLALQILITGSAIVLAHAAAAKSAYTPGRTAWGDPDLQGTWPIDRIADAGIPLERPEPFGDRLLLNDQEFAARLAAARKSDAGVTRDVVEQGTSGLAEWLQSTPFARRSSLLVAPANGRVPPLTPQAEVLYRAGRTSWKPGQPIDWVTDLDSYDRCVSRGFPTSMLPFPYNGGIRLFQSPGFVVLQLEVLGTRIIPVGHGEQWPQAVRGWLGQSRGRWEGDTLVIETTNLVAGDSAANDVAKRAAPPLQGRKSITIPVSEQASAVERLTMTGPNTIAYRVTYTDPEVFTAPLTIELEWTRNAGYRLYEFACHEGNQQVRNMIAASRAQRKSGQAVAAAARPEDGLGNWPVPARP